MGMPTCTVQLRGPDGINRVSVGVGAGPVDAAYKAIDGLVRVDAELVDYSVNSVTEGIQALATTRVSIRPTGEGQTAVRWLRPDFDGEATALCCSSVPSDWEQKHW
jgi:hypothetical protein